MNTTESKPTLEARRWYVMAHCYGNGAKVAAITPTDTMIRSMFGYASRGLSEPAVQWEAIHEDGSPAHISALDIGRPGIGELTGPTDDAPITDEDITALRAKWAQTLAKNAADRADAARAAEADRAALPARFPWLESYAAYERRTGRRMSNYALGAHNLRRDLAHAFPGVKFSARSKSYSGGCSIDADWNDGPTERTARAIITRYQKCDFDGMQDLETSRDNRHAEVFGGASYASGSRGMSDQTRAILEAWAAERVSDPNDGCAAEHRDRNFPSCIAHQLHAATELPAGAVVRAVERIPEGEDAPSGQWPACFWRIVYDVPQAAQPAAPADPDAASAPITGATITENAEKAGIEIRFPARPADSVLSALKASGWRWSRFTGCWYKHAAEGVRAEAERIASES